MNRPQTKMELYGVPQGNELVWGRLILRQTETHKFKKIAYFDNYLDANNAFHEWLEEYSEHQYCDGENND